MRVQKNFFINLLYREEIDGLRAVAVLAVIIQHFNKSLLPSGFLGVDIFFVISGYVITSSLANKNFKSLKELIKEFYYKRIKRIFPALIVFVLVTSILICFFDPEPIFNLRSGISSIFGLSNLYFFKHSTNYFSESTEFNPFTHTWSLGVEEQYYLLFPFIVWFTGFSRKVKFGKKYFFIIISILTTISLIGFLYIYPKNQSAAYFLMPFRFWEIGIGSLMFLLNQKKSVLKINNDKFATLLFIVILGCFLLPINWSIISIPLMVFLISLFIYCINENNTVYKCLTNNKILHIGKISYSLYLWHWGILSLSRWTVGIHFWTVPIQLISIYFLSLISYFYIENPIRFSNISRKYILIISSFISFLIFGILFLINKFSSNFYLGNFQNDIELQSNIINGKSNLNCDFRLKNNFDYSRVNDCTYFDEGTKNSLIRIYFVGSSHAGTLSGMVEKIIPQIDAKKINLYVGGAFFPSLERDLYVNVSKETYDNLNNFNNNQDLIQKYLYSHANKGDTIIIANHLQMYFDTSYREMLKKTNSEEISIKKYFLELDNFTTQMNEKKVDIVYVEPYPIFKEFLKDNKITNTKRCSKQWFNEFNDIESCDLITSRSKLLNSFALVNKNIESLQDKHNNFFVFKTFDKFCPQNIEDICTNKIGNKIYLYDADHLNNFGGGFISNDFKEFYYSIKKKYQ